MRESAVAFGPANALIGIVTEPRAALVRPDRPAFIILNSGLVHRVGPKRMHVVLARRLAARGFVSMRIDFSGIGDSRVGGSSGSLRERWLSEAAAAMRYLRESRGIDRFVPLGNCSGANMSYLLALAEPRVVGAGLINPQGLPALRYYARLFLTNAKIWRRMLTGSRWIRRNRALNQPMMPRDSGSAAPRPTRATVLHGIRSLTQRGVRLLIVNCEWDRGYDFFQYVIRRDLDASAPDGLIRLESVPRADHDFNLIAGQQRLLRIIEQWSDSLLSPGDPAASARVASADRETPAWTAPRHSPE